jgi:hypothetical protein
MGESMHRTQILLEPEQHRVLAEMAAREGRSISDLVREMVREQIARHDASNEAVLGRRLRALERIRRHREEIVGRRGGELLRFDVVGAIEEMRDERDARNLAGQNDAGN